MRTRTQTEIGACLTFRVNTGGQGESLVPPDTSRVVSPKIIAPIDVPTWFVDATSVECSFSMTPCLGLGRIELPLCAVQHLVPHIRGIRRVHRRRLPLGPGSCCSPRQMFDVQIKRRGLRVR